MKNQFTTTFLTLIFICLHSPLFAQPVLTYSNNAPQPGETYVSYMANTPPAYSAASVGGANMTWDFSNVTSTGGTIYTHFAPNTTQFWNLYPQANVTCQMPFWGTSLIYQLADSSGIQELGFNGMVWDNPKTLMQYPFTYNDTFSDTGSYNSPPYNWIWHINTIADGYGTVILPYGTVNNVLRVSESVNRFSGFGWIPEQAYIWYQPGTHTPICYFWIDVIDLFFFYREPQVTGLNETENKMVQIYPNPFINQVSITVPYNISGSYSLTVYDLSGRHVHHANISGINNRTFSQDLSFLNSGIYLLQLQSDDSIYQSRVVKQ